MIRTGVLIFACWLLPASLAAGPMYKWQDADGIWHFGDKPPPEGEAYDTFSVPNEPRNMVTMRQAGTDREPVHYFFNHYYGPAQIELRLVENQNVIADPPLPARFMLTGQTERELVRFRPRDERQGYRYRLSYSLVPGPPQQRLPGDLNYYPPFPEGMRFPISQGLDDDRTHKDPGNRFAVDIVMPIGTPVLAARGGIVMEVEDDFQGEGRQEPKYLLRANQVRILHDDGSMGVYAHLDSHSARVHPGQRVPTGHWIANSGNTGYSSGPHLHFVVQMNIGMALESLPFQFRRPDGGIMDPDRPQFLRGVLPHPSP